MFHCKESYSLKEIDSIAPCSTSCLGNKEENRPTCTHEVAIQTQQPARHSLLLGFFYTFLTSVFMTGGGVLVQKLSYIDPGHLSMVRNAGTFAGCLPIAVYKVEEVLGPPKKRLLLTLRGFLGATSIYLIMIAYRYLPLAETVIVLAINPAVTAIAAKFYLNEPCGRLHVVSLVTTLWGVLLSVRLPELFSQTRDDARFDAMYLAGLASAIAVVVFFAFTFVALRKMRGLHFSVSALYVGFIGMVENAVISFPTTDVVYPRCGWDIVLVMLVGVFGVFVQIFLNLSLQVEAAGIIAVFKSSTDIIVAMILQITFIDNDIDVYNISGACLVILSVSVIGLNKWLHTLPEQSKARSQLKCLM